MTKTPLRLVSNDLTTFTRSLLRQLGDDSPSHLTLMNMVARAAGYRNVQHMRASDAASRRLGNTSQDEQIDGRLLERTLAQFDDGGRLRQWPSRQSVQTIALWAMWACLPARDRMPERVVNDLLASEHLFGDAATLRRTMISCSMLTRNTDGSVYLRVEQEPPSAAKALIREISRRRQSRSTAADAAKPK